MLVILIFKWIIVFSMIGVSIYHYRLERTKLNKIAKQIHDPELIAELKSDARTRMTHFFLLFAAFIIWILSYDLQIENVNKEKTQLASELQIASQKYANAASNQNRLIKAQTADPNMIDDIKSYYTDIFVNYYVMRKCNLAGTDDVFIINSAMLRELRLNNINLEMRDEVINSAKDSYLKKYSNAECKQITSNYQNLTSNYQNYIAAVREVLKATF